MKKLGILLSIISLTVLSSCVKEGSFESVLKDTKKEITSTVYDSVKWYMNSSVKEEGNIEFKALLEEGLYFNADLAFSGKTNNKTFNTESNFNLDVDTNAYIEPILANINIDIKSNPYQDSSYFKINNIEVPAFLKAMIWNIEFKDWVWIEVPQEESTAITKNQLKDLYVFYKNLDFSKILVLINDNSDEENYDYDVSFNKEVLKSELLKLVKILNKESYDSLESEFDSMDLSWLDDVSVNIKINKENKSLVTLTITPNNAEWLLIISNKQDGFHIWFENGQEKMTLDSVKTNENEYAINLVVKSEWFDLDVPFVLNISENSYSLELIESESMKALYPVAGIESLKLKLTDNFEKIKDFVPTAPEKSVTMEDYMNSLMDSYTPENTSNLDILEDIDVIEEN